MDGVTQLPGCFSSGLLNWNDKMPRTKSPKQTEKRCPHCGETKPASEFYYTGRGRLYSWCKVCVRSDSKRYPLSQHHCWLKKAYGITLEQYDEMAERQGDRCGICGTDSPGEKYRWFCVDHCHKTGVVRGLLCHHCNWLLGRVGDDPEVLRKAIEYLENPPALEFAAIPGATGTQGSCTTGS